MGDCVSLQIGVHQLDDSDLDKHAEQAVRLQHETDVEHRGTHLQGAHKLNNVQSYANHNFSEKLLF